MKKVVRLTLLFLINFPLSTIAQQANKETTDNKTATVSSDPFLIKKSSVSENMELTLNLEAIGHTYKETYSYYVFHKGKSTNTSVVNKKIGSNKSIIITLRLKTFSLGEYTIDIRNENDQTLYTRSFKLVSDPPKIKKITLTKSDIPTDTLMLDSDEIKNYKIYFEGAYLDTKKSSAYIQNSQYKLKSIDSLCYQLGENWNPIPSSIKLGWNKIWFKTAQNDSAQAKIFLKSAPPIINDTEFRAKVKKEGGKAELTLHVDNLFENPVLDINANFYIGKTIKNVNVSDGTIDVELTFSSLEQDTFIQLRLKNKFSAYSKYKTLSLELKDNDIEIAPFNDEMPFIGQYVNEIIIKKTDNATRFQYYDKNSFYLIFNNGVKRQLNVKEVDNDQIIATIEFPNIKDDVSIQLKNGHALWNGEIENINEYPKVIVDKKEVLEYNHFMVNKGGTFNLQVSNENVSLIDQFDNCNSITEITDSKNEYKNIEINVSNDAQDFSLISKIGESIIDTLNFKVMDIINGDSIHLNEVLNENPVSINKNRVTINSHLNNLTLTLPHNNGSIISPSDYTAKIFNNDGTEVVEKCFSDKYKTTFDIAKKTDFSTGDEFYVKIYGPQEQTLKTIDIYKKRNWYERINFTAGVAALDWRFKDDEASIFECINIGSYYMFEFSDVTDYRFLGVGPNLFFSLDDDDKVVFRYGASVYIAEKIMVGLSYGQTELGFTLGFNVDFADLSDIID